jgi:hypothetical protein
MVHFTSNQKIKECQNIYFTLCVFVYVSTVYVYVCECVR